MSHFVAHLLVTCALLLIAKSVRQLAEKSTLGVEGRITLLARLLPLVPLSFFTTFAVFALQDPDLGDRLAGVFVLICALLLFLVLVHYWTYRLVLTDEWILTQSLIGSDRIIHLSMPFDLTIDHEQKHFTLRQDGKKLKVMWIVSGYPDILSRVLDTHNHAIRHEKA